MKRQIGSVDFTTKFRKKATRLEFKDGPLDLRWHHCGVTSDFLSEFCVTGFSGNHSKRKDAQHSISYLVNELLENAVKFRASDVIVIESQLADNEFRLCISNSLDETVANDFQQILCDLVAGDPGELLIERIEMNAADPESKGSGLGLLTLMNDYGARLGWTFRRDEHQPTIWLETQAVLTLE